MLNRLLDLIYPENLYCLCCGDTIESSRVHGICDVCAEKIKWELDDPFKTSRGDYAFDEVISCCRYGFFARKIMNGLKESGKPYMAMGPGKLMAERVKLHGGSFSALVPVPMHKEKLAKRGFNQSLLLARAAASELGLPVWEALLKTEKTASMRGSDGAARRAMLRNAFILAEGYEEKLHGKKVLLVDDVCTTGSTADACSAVLRSAGASVSLLCFASAASEGVRDPTAFDRI